MNRLAAVVCLLTASPLLAAVQSRIDYYEEYYPDNDDNLHTLAIDNTLTSDHAINWQYPVAAYSTSNTRAYVNPLTHKLGAQSVSDTSGDILSAPGDVPIDWHHTNRRIVTADAYYTDHLTVSSASQPLGTPVRIQFTLRADGRAELGNPDPNPGSTTTDAHGSATFSVYDPTLTYHDPETGRDFPAGPIAQLSVEAYAHQETTPPNPTNPYAINGAWTRTFNSYWSAFSNATDELTGQDHDQLDLGYPDAPYSQGGGGYRSAITVDSGTVTLLVDTYVGAQLDLLGGVTTYAYSSYQSSLARADFLHTLGFDFAPAPGYESYALSLDLASSSVPEPTSLSLLALPMLLAPRRRRSR